MAHPALRPPKPALLFFGVLTRYDEVFDLVRERVTSRWGPLHVAGESPKWPFPDTRTYSKSMGTDLMRRFFTVAALWPQDGLASTKHAALALEEEIALYSQFDVARPVNIDPGLINECRVILASTKDYAHRLYRGDSIWEEITLVFRGGKFETLPWTYPDFRSEEYHTYFAQLRQSVLDAR